MDAPQRMPAMSSAMDDLRLRVEMLGKQIDGLEGRLSCVLRSETAAPEANKVGELRKARPALVEDIDKIADSVRAMIARTESIHDRLEL